VAVLWAVQNGHFDDVPVEGIKDVQAAWTDFLSTRRPEVLQRIAKEQALSDDLTAAVRAAMDEFRQTRRRP